MEIFQKNLIMVDISKHGDDSLEKICQDIEKKKIQVTGHIFQCTDSTDTVSQKTHRDIINGNVELFSLWEEALHRKLMT